MATDHYHHHTSTTVQQVDGKVKDGVVPAEKNDVSSSKGSEEILETEETSCPETLSSNKKGAAKEQVEPSVIEVQRNNGAPVADATIEEKMEVDKDKLHDAVKSEPEAEEQSSAETIQTEQEEQLKIIGVREAANEATEKQGDAFEILVVEEPKVEVKGIENSVGEATEAEKLDAIVPEVEEKVEMVSTQVEKPDSRVSEVDVKPEAPSEEVKHEEVEPKEDVEGEKVKEKETSADKLEDSASLNDEKIHKEEDLSASTTSEQIVSTNLKAEATQKEDNEKSSLPDASEMVGPKDESKEADVAADKVGEGNDAKTIRIDGEEEEKSVTTEESTHSVKVEDVKSNNDEVTEMTFPGENADKDAEQVENKNEETAKDEKPATVEMKEDGKAEGKPHEVSRAVNEPVKELHKSEVEVKDKETRDTKASHDLPKEAPPAKPTQKQSNNIISKVKQSLVKAKKAIFGKSPSSKTLSSETKGDIKVK